MPVTLLLAALLAAPDAPPAPGPATETPTTTAESPSATTAGRSASFGFDRVDVLSEDPGTWLHYEMPMMGTYPTAPALRFVEQVKVVFGLPVKGLYAGVAIGSQSLVYEYPLLADKGVFLTGGLQTRLLFPRGVLVGVAWRVGMFRFGASLSAITGGSWQRPGDTAFLLLPTLGVGIGRAYEP
jgi:hypothetical protein